MQSNYKPIGDYIQLVDERNKGLIVKQLLGLSISKQFIPSVANIIGTDMENYKIIRKNQFACSTMQVRRDKKMPVALLQEVDEAIISQAYPIFEVKDEKELLPEYLMMWFSREEFDREACFHAVGGVRGSLEWDDFCTMKFPLPLPEKQREIVTEYNTIKNRIELNKQLIQKLEETAQAIYKQWFIDFEFPDKNGNPYKSSGGAMVFNEELDKEIPEGWKLKKLSGISKIIMGQSPVGESYNEEGIGVPLVNGPVEFGEYFTVKTKWTSDPKKYCEKNDLVFCVRGSTVGKYVTADDRYAIGRGVCAINSNNPFFLKLLIKSNLTEILKDVTGSTFPNIDRKTLEAYQIVLGSNELPSIFEEKLASLNQYMRAKQLENNNLSVLKDILLSKLAIIEN